MASCFDNLIGINGVCDAVIPSSGLYINSLTGINIDAVNSIHDSEYISGIDLIKEKIKYSTEAIKQALMGSLNTQLKSNSILLQSTKGFYKDNNSKKSISIDNKYGIIFKIKNHAYTEFSLNSITLRFDDNTNGTLYVYDLNNGEELYNTPFTALGNQYNRITINKVFPNYKQILNLFICYNNSII